jgi:hypothetical protein
MIGTSVSGLDDFFTRMGLRINGKTKTRPKFRASCIYRTLTQSMTSHCREPME